MNDRVVTFEVHDVSVNDTELTSQYGEDRFLLDYFDKHPPTKKLLVDVGAKGKSESNTYVLLKHRGWWGFLIEPHPESFVKMRNEFAFARDRIVCANVAIGDHLFMNHDYLHCHDVPGHSSLLFKTVPGDLNVANPGVESIGKPHMVEVMTLDAFFIVGAVPDDVALLCIDTEGMDSRIIMYMLQHTEIRPGVVVFEHTTHHGTTDEEASIATDAMYREGYSMLYKTIANTIMGFET